MTKVLTPARRARLEKLATYLEGLPKSYRHFDMQDFLGKYTGAEVAYALKNGGVAQCGTVACAVGHGPAAGVLAPKRMVRETGSGKLEIDWHAYTELFIRDHEGGGDGEDAFDWCFGSSWQHSDNHHWGAAARIRYLLDKGKAPEGFSYVGERKWKALYAPYRIDAKVAAA